MTAAICKIRAVYKKIWQSVTYRNRLLRRYTPRNDVVFVRHCEQSAAICKIRAVLKKLGNLCNRSRLLRRYTPRNDVPFCSSTPRKVDFYRFILHNNGLFCNFNL